MEKEIVTLDNFTKESNEWRNKVEVELAQPYGIFAVGVTQ